jgi:hypothetical protein
MNALLHVVLVRHETDAFGADVLSALRTAFGIPVARPGGASPFDTSAVRALVHLHEVTQAQDLSGLLIPPGSRILWIVLARSDMARDAPWKAALDRILQSLDAADGSETANLLLFATDEAVEAMPELQSWRLSALGEHRIAPYRLALLALHRSRLLLGRAGGGAQKLKLFISHAKADGVFFADALRNAIAQIPELEAWYDAADILPGARWRLELEENASSSILVALRTEAYSNRPACVEEFQWALQAGVPVVVVDALLGAEIPPSPLPFAAVPTVRVQDGNTFRVLAAALREHLRILLVETRVAEECARKAPGLPPTAWRVWPRLPGFHAIQAAVAGQDPSAPLCIVVADVAGPEINAAAALLQRLSPAGGSTGSLAITTAEHFGDFAVLLSESLRQEAPSPP